MRITELIEKLERVNKLHGDLEVKVYEPRPFTSMSAEPLNFIRIRRYSKFESIEIGEDLSKLNEPHVALGNKKEDEEED